MIFHGDVDAKKLPELPPKLPPEAEASSLKDSVFGRGKATCGGRLVSTGTAKSFQVSHFYGVLEVDDDIFF